MKSLFQFPNRIILTLLLLLSLGVDLARGFQRYPDDARRFTRTDPVTSRLFLAPTGRVLDRGMVSLSVLELFIPYAQVGLGGGASVGAGTSLAPEAPAELIYVGGKVGFHARPTSAVAGGVILATNLGLWDEQDGSFAGIGSLSATLGDTERAVTLGLSGGFTDNGEYGFGAVVLGGELQVSNRVKLMSENWLAPGFSENSTAGEGNETTFFMAFGTRFFGDRFALDLAAVVSPEIWEELELPAAPWIGLSILIGRLGVGN